MLDPFDDDVVAAVAAEYDREQAAVRDLLSRHQSFVCDLTGVEELVHDWRKAMPYDPLVARTPGAYVCAVLPSVWTEFADQMGLDAADRETLMAVHRRQARRLGDVHDDAEAVVLART